MLADAIVGHLVGDYLLQNDWMAREKKRDSWVCAVHSSIWGTAVTLFAGLSWPAMWVLIITHFIQDRGNLVQKWMDLVGQRDFREGPCAPWSVIVVDNVWHIVTIWMVINWEKISDFLVP